MEYEKNLSRYELRGLSYVQHPHDSAALTGGAASANDAIANVPIVAVALSMLRRWEEDVIVVLSSSSSVEATCRILNLDCDLATGITDAAFDRGVAMVAMTARRKNSQRIAIPAKNYLL